MEAARHLSLVDRDTGEVVEQEATSLHQQIAELEAELRAKRSQITRLKNDNARLMGVEPEHDDILGVLEFWREKCHPRAPIVVGSDGWKAVRARLRETDASTGKPAFTPLALKAAVVGVLLSDFHVANRKQGYLHARSIFADADRVRTHIGRAVSFKERKGISALTIIDELGGSELEWLADRCSCGGLRIQHLKSGLAHQPCPERDCPAMDEFQAKIERFMAERAA